MRTDAADSLGEAKLAARLIPVAPALAEGAAAGECYHSVRRQGRSDPKQVRVGAWKEPHHQARACLEIMRRGGSLKVSVVGRLISFRRDLGSAASSSNGCRRR